MDMWAYPVAFGRPILEIMQTPKRATVQAFTAAGSLSNGQAVSVNDTIAIHYRVEPPGSDAGVAPSVYAPGGVVTPSGRLGVLFYRPSSPGDNPVELTWGNVKVTIPVSVKSAANPRNRTPA